MGNPFDPSSTSDLSACDESFIYIYKIWRDEILATAWTEYIIIITISFIVHRECNNFQL